MNAEENIKRKFGDKEYTAYEATQRQRELERVMRKYGEETHLLELGGADEDTVLATKVRYQTASHEYAAFSNAMGLPQQRERIRNGMESLAQYADTAQKPLDFSGGSGIIEKNRFETAENGVLTVGKLDKKIFSCVTNDIVTDEVVITEQQIEHIQNRHPNDYERFHSYFSEIVRNPDYIIESNKPNTALILKEISIDGEKFKTVLRLATSKDNPSYKNSIITFMKIDEKEQKRLLRNKKVLYKSE